MCGAVSFTAKDVPDTFGACHCEMCRRWTGSAYLEVDVPMTSIDWTGAEHIRRFQSSDWAERAWCGTCGTHLYYHVTIGGPHGESLSLSLGLLDDHAGLTFESEIFIDVKPACFAYAGERAKTMTRDQVMAMFGGAESGGAP